MRTAEIHTEHGDADVARAVAAAIRPDNTAEMTTTVEGDAIHTTIRRETTGGLQSTVDDYVVNVQLADQLTTDTTNP